MVYEIFKGELSRVRPHEKELLEMYLPAIFYDFNFSKDGIETAGWLEQDRYVGNENTQ